MNSGHDELDELLGAYALNALTAEEQAAVEAYLEVSPRAAAEVADHLSVAAALAGTTSEPSAPSWDRIVAAIDAAERDSAATSTTPDATHLPRAESPNPASVGAASAGASVLSMQEHRSRRAVAGRTITRFAAVAASVAIVGLGVQTSRQETRLRNLRTELAAEQRSVAEARKEATALASRDQFNVETVLAAPGARVAPLNDNTDHAVGRVLLDANGRGFLVLSTDQQIESGKAYQLWGVSGKSVISLGVMSPGTPAMPLSAAGDWSQFVLTVEALPGVVTSAGPAVASGTFVS